MKMIILLSFLAMSVGAVLAIKYLPWWALLGLVAVLAVVAKFAVKKLLRKAILIPFKMKGAALRGATVEILSLVPVEAPTALEDSPDTGAEASSAGRSFYELDVTIKPSEQVDGPFQGWELGEIRLVKPESRIDPNSDESSDEDDSCRIERFDVWQEGAFVVDEGWKFQGPQRLKLLLAVKPGTRSLKFRYYFEEFGQLVLPDNSAAHAA